jgi:hypothetical protein
MWNELAKFHTIVACGAEIDSPLMIYTYVANTNALHNKAIAQPPTSINGSDQERERERER